MPGVESPAVPGEEGTGETGVESPAVPGEEKTIAGSSIRRSFIAMKSDR